MHSETEVVYTERSAIERAVVSAVHNLAIFRISVPSISDVKPRLDRVIAVLTDGRHGPLWTMFVFIQNKCTAIDLDRLSSVTVKSDMFGTRRVTVEVSAGCHLAWHVVGDTLEDSLEATVVTTGLVVQGV